MDKATVESGAVIRLSAEQLAFGKAMMGRAFQDDPLLVYVVPDHGRRAQLTPELYGGIMRYCLLYGESYVTADMGGAACWLPPHHSSPELARMIRAGMLRVPLKFGWRGFKRLNRFERYSEAVHKNCAPGPHWYLWALGVEPERQGQGIGGRLLLPVLEKADAEKTPCYLETQNEKNVGFYEKHGFNVARRGEVVKEAVTSWAMLREPQG